MVNRREFIKMTALAGAAMTMAPMAALPVTIRRHPANCSKLAEPDIAMHADKRPAHPN